MAEIELKLAVAAGDLPKVRAALLGMAGRPRPSRTTLTTTYYDSDDDALRRRDLILRVRKKGRQFIQTVKDRDLASGDAITRANGKTASAAPSPISKPPNPAPGCAVWWRRTRSIRSSSRWSSARPSC